MKPISALRNAPYGNTVPGFDPTVNTSFEMSSLPKIRAMRG